MHPYTSTHELTSEENIIWRSVVMKVHSVLRGRPQSVQYETMHGFGTSGTAKRVDHTLAPMRVEVFYAVPAHAVRAPRNVVQISVSNERPQLRFVDLKLFPGGSVLLFG